ncbi:MAG TPA: hypothetical protein VKA63_08195 [Candidatus Krumholzibacteria bacterium]|nr:hypothetical protein [Candidatus Krumholzibacteria bacterium]
MKKSIFQSLKTSRSLLAVTLLLLVACAGGTIVLNLDFLSFINEEDLSTNYAAEVPGTGTWVPVVGLIPPTKIDLLEGLGTASLMEEGTLHLKGEFDNQSGEAELRFDLFLGATAADAAASTTPIMSIPVSVQDATVTPVSGSTQLDQDTLELFSGNEVWLRVDIYARTPAGPTLMNLSGSASLSDLHARLLSKEDLIRQ